MRHDYQFLLCWRRLSDAPHSTEELRSAFFRDCEGFVPLRDDDVLNVFLRARPSTKTPFCTAFVDALSLSTNHKLRASAAISRALSPEAAHRLAADESARVTNHLLRSTNSLALTFDEIAALAPRSNEHEELAWQALLNQLALSGEKKGVECAAALLEKFEKGLPKDDRPGAVVYRTEMHGERLLDLKNWAKDAEAPDRENRWAMAQHATTECDEHKSETGRLCEAAAVFFLAFSEETPSGPKPAPALPILPIWGEDVAAVLSDLEDGPETDEVLRKMVQTADERILNVITFREKLPSDVIAQLAKEPNIEIRRALLQNRTLMSTLPFDDILSILDDDPELICELAGHCPPQLASLLAITFAANDDPAVRNAIAALPIDEDDGSFTEVPEREEAEILDKLRGQEKETFQALAQFLKSSS